MEAKVIIATATNSTIEILNNLVIKINSQTAIRSYPSVDNEAVFFPVDKYDLLFVTRVLKDKGISYKIEDAQ